MAKILQFVKRRQKHTSSELGDILKWQREEVTKLQEVLRLEKMLNEKQCSNLVAKLDQVVLHMSKIIESTKESSNIFGLVVEELCCITRKTRVLVQDCGKQEWCHALTFQMNNREAFRELGDDLKCCWDAMWTRYLAIYSDARNDMTPSIDYHAATYDEIESDENAMVERLHNHIQTMPNKSKDYELARHLWRRLEYDLERSQGAELDGLEIQMHVKKPEVLKRIGHGAAGEVYISSWLGLRSATKMVKCHPNFCKEVGILACLSHPNLIKFICCGRFNAVANDSSWLEHQNGTKLLKVLGNLMNFISFGGWNKTNDVPKDLFLVLELMDTSLSGVLKQEKKPLPYLVSINIMYEIARGMCYLHDMHVAHLDLKPDNVLLSRVSRLAKMERNIGYDFVKLTDYDASKTEVQTKPEPQKHVIGTPRYMAPEMNNNKDNGVFNVASPFQADVWSFAMTCSEILSLREPFPDTKSRKVILQRIKIGLRPELPINCNELTMLVNECWVEDPLRRPTFSEICERLARLKEKFMVGTYPNGYAQFDKNDTPSLTTQLKVSTLVSIVAPKKVDEQRIQQQVVVGLQNNLQNVRCHLNMVNVLGLIGMGGIGKTTLAKAILNEKNSTYDASNSIENMKQKSSLEILYEIFQKFGSVKLSEDLECGELVHAQSKVRELLATKKILLVLDDPKDASQVDDIIPVDVPYFNNGTKIIITTRIWGVVKNRVDIKGRIDVGKLDDNAAKELFDFSVLLDGVVLSPEFSDLRDKIVKACNGLPLSLKILGAFLQGKERIRSWERAFQRMKRGRHLDGDEGLWSTMRISFDGLESDAKNMFLDIACFFPMGMIKATTLPNYCTFANHVLDVLVEKSLVLINKEGFLEMHDQLRDMGRMICEIDEYRGTRIWKSNMLPLANGSTYDKKYEKVQAIYLDEDIFQYFLDKSMGIGYLDMSSLRFLICSELKTSIGTFGNISSLTTIYFFKCYPQGLENFLALTTLVLETLPITILPESLWTLTSLTTLHLQKCWRLTMLSEGLGNLISLTNLELHDCSNLTTLPQGLGKLSSLTSLDLSKCLSLTILPKELGNLTSLRNLDLHECLNLITLPEGLGNLISLISLNLHNCSNLTTLPKGLGNLTSLMSLDMGWCLNLTTLLEGLGNLVSLTSLDLDNCYKLTRLPEGLGKLTSMTSLDLNNCTDLTRLPEGLGNLTLLTNLNLHGCSSLTTLPKVLSNLILLTSLDLHDCCMLTTLPEGLGNLTSLKSLDLSSCSGLTTLPEELGNLISLTSLDLHNCIKVTTLPEGLGKLTSLTNLDLHNCFGLTTLPKGLGNLMFLRSMNLHKCTNLTTLPKELDKFTHLSTLDLSNCSSLTVLPPGLGNLISMMRLDLHDCVS